MFPLLRGFEKMSFERAVSYVEKAEEMAFQEYTKGNWTDDENHKLLIKTLDEAARTDFMDRI
jgi:hypothetical protein